MGVPTEAALLVLSEKLGVSAPKEQERISAQRRKDADSHPCGAVLAYNSRCALVASVYQDSSCCHPCVAALAHNARFLRPSACIGFKELSTMRHSCVQLKVQSLYLLVYES